MQGITGPYSGINESHGALLGLPIVKTTQKQWKASKLSFNLCICKFQAEVYKISACLSTRQLGAGSIQPGATLIGDEFVGMLSTIYISMHDARSPESLWGNW